MSYIKQFSLLLAIALPALGLTAGAAVAGERIVDSDGDPYHGAIEADQVHATFDGPGSADVDCAIGQSTGTLDSEEDVAYGAIAFTFANCTLAGFVPCAVTIDELPLSYHLAIGTHDAEFVLATPYHMEVNCILASCEFTAPADTMRGRLTPGLASALTFTSQPVTLTEGSFCGIPGDEGYWTSEFEITHPADGLFIDHS